MIRDYDRLVEATAHIEIMVEAEEARQKLKKMGATQNPEVIRDLLRNLGVHLHHFSHHHSRPSPLVL